MKILFLLLWLMYNLCVIAHRKDLEGVHYTSGIRDINQLHRPTLTEDSHRDDTTIDRVSASALNIDSMTSASSGCITDSGGDLENRSGSGTFLRRVVLSDLGSILFDRCALFCVEPCEHSHAEILTRLCAIFQQDNSTFFGILADGSNIAWRHDIEHPTKLAFYPREVRDRTCLLVPPKTGFAAEGVSGLVKVETLVQFVNEKCGTFRTLSGGLTNTGEHHHHVMSKLFHPEHLTGECERIRMPTKSQFVRDYLLRSKPVVIKNAIANWPAIRRWTADYLHRLYGPKKIHVKLTPDGIFEGVEDSNLWHGYSDDRIPEKVRSQLLFPDLVVVRPASSEMSFADFLDLISSGNVSYSAYLEYSSIPDHLPNLERDILELPFVKGLLKRRHLNIWLSDGNTLGKLHFDPYDNLLCQVCSFHVWL